jgi:Holliday junction resolvasome RuvABC endonuclease subunit
MKKPLTRKSTKPFTVLALDPSLTAFGYSIVEGNKHVIDFGCIKTNPSDKKLRIRKGDDRMRRISEINDVLIDKMNKYDLDYIVSELPHGSQSATAAMALGMVSALVQTLADVWMVGIEWFSEADSKRFVLGKQSATKKEMIQAIDKLFKVDWTGIGYKDEAIADSLAIYYSAWKYSPMFKKLKNA